MESCVPTRFLSDHPAVFFIGIGGVSMSSLAMIANHLGCQVGGSDKTLSKVTNALRDAGIEIFEGHDASHLTGYEIVVYTAAIHEDNPELAFARKSGVTVMTRAEFLGLLMKDYPSRIGVAGTHGKSTVTSMLASIYLAAGRDPTVVSGASLDAMGGSYRIGNGNEFVFEACEYTDSFLSFFPTTAVITNIEYDHSDYFKTFEQMFDSFCRYASIASRCILNFDDPMSEKLASQYEGESISWSLERQDTDYGIADLKYQRGFPSFKLLHHGEEIGEITLQVPGRHNAADAVAASAEALSDGIPFPVIRDALASFRGASRRFERRGTLNGAPVYSDYAHHPTELKATLNAARFVTGKGGRVICVFQPHTYTRTETFFEGFIDALSSADFVYLAEIYAAREVNQTGISSEKIAERLPRAACPGTLEAIAEVLGKEVRPEDTVLIVGAGDVNRLEQLLPLRS